jgi:hypothetical protein
MNKKIIFVLLIVCIVGTVFAFNIDSKTLRIVKDNAYVPSPIASEFHAKYIQENYVQIINEDETVSFVKVIN